MGERTGWRDQAISTKHRDWGLSAEAYDLDFLLIECKRAVPVALIEYKHKMARPCKKTDPQYRALIELSNRADLPAFNVRYEIFPNSHDCLYSITPLNVFASNHNPPKGEVNELEYMKFLHGLRGTSIPADAMTSWIADNEWLCPVTKPD